MAQAHPAKGGADRSRQPVEQRLSRPGRHHVFYALGPQPYARIAVALLALVFLWHRRALRRVQPAAVWRRAQQLLGAQAAPVTNSLACRWSGLSKNPMGTNSG